MFFTNYWNDLIWSFDVNENICNVSFIIPEQQFISNTLTGIIKLMYGVANCQLLLAI